jgi:hypothetical protein
MYEMDFFKQEKYEQIRFKLRNQEWLKNDSELLWRFADKTIYCLILRREIPNAYGPTIQTRIQRNYGH